MEACSAPQRVAQGDSQEATMILTILQVVAVLISLIAFNLFFNWLRR